MAMLEIPQQISGTGNEGSALGAKRTLSDWGCVHLQDLMDSQRTLDLPWAWQSQTEGLSPCVLQPRTEEGSGSQ